MKRWSDLSTTVGGFETPEYDVAVVVPVYQNSATIAPLAERVAQVLDAVRPSYRLIFVVDASPDDSWRIVEHLARNDVRVCGLLLASNQGQHRAVLAGLNVARAHWVAVMDADLQDPPELLAALIEECERSDKSVFAQRKERYQRRGRMLTSRIFKSILDTFFGIPADVGTFFVAPRHVVDRMCRAPVRHVQVVVMARMFSDTRKGLPYVRKLREEGESAYSFVGRLRAGGRGLACALECRKLLRNGYVVEPEDQPFAVHPVAARVNI